MALGQLHRRQYSPCSSSRCGHRLGHGPSFQHTARQAARRRPTVQAASATGYSADLPDDDSPAAAPASVKGTTGASFPATVFNLVNVIMGAGYVSIPFACRQGGWAALLVLWLLGAVFCYTGNTILQCCAHVDQQQRRQQRQQQQQQQQPPETTESMLGETSPNSSTPSQAAATSAGYEDVAGAAFGPLGKLLVSGVMYAELLGICCVYVVLEAEALSTLLANTAVGTWLRGAFGANAFIVASTAVILPTVLLPSVEALATLGAIGVMAAVAVGCVVATMFINNPYTQTALQDTHIVQLATLPQVLGVLAFVFAGHSTFPVIQQSMANVKLGQRAVTFGYASTAVICTLIGGFGYALWGSATEQVVTANLPPGSVLAICLTALTATNPFSAFAVTLEPVALVVQQRLWRNQTASKPAANQSGPLTPYYVRAVIRLGLALTCCVTAALMPYVADLMAFVGALLTMTISLILPAMMHLQLFRAISPTWLLLFDVGIVVLGLACAYVGASSAATNLHNKLAIAL